MDKRKESILKAKTALGIELGTTRIKAVLTDEYHEAIAMGTYEWTNKYIDGMWTYSLEDIWTGIKGCYEDLSSEVKRLYDMDLISIGAIGISAMMHGYMAFDKYGEILVPFRTWRNTTTGDASARLSRLFQYNIPQRWSIAHLYQAILNEEEHVKDITYLVSLAGYVHWKLTGERVLGIGDATGVFPTDSSKKVYNENFLEKFDQLVVHKGLPWKISDILPEILMAGEVAGKLTEEGARLLDPSGKLMAGINFCPPEGDAGTGMVATNSVSKRAGNISAGTSVFAMLVLEKELAGFYEEIDMVATPAGDPVAMVHSNNCTSDINAWATLFYDFAKASGRKLDMGHIFTLLFNKALEGDKDCGGLLSYGYLSGEHITGFEEGRPLFVRLPDANFSLANFMKTNLYSALAALRLGMDILYKKENVKVDRFIGHGGFFKTKGVGQRIMSGALNTPISILDSAGEGGAFGIALLASFMLNKSDGETLDLYLKDKVFQGNSGSTVEPRKGDIDSFNAFMERYVRGLPIQRAAVENFE